MPDTETTGIEPRLYLTVGSYTDLWHRFKKPKQHPRFGVYLSTKCGQEIYDHSNVRSIYNPRIDRFCSRCFPFGINPDGSYKHRPEPATDAEGTTDSSEGERSDAAEGQPLTSTPEPLVPSTPDGGDDGPASEEGSGVLGTEDTGHVDELPEGGETGSDTTVGSADQEGGQGSKVREPVRGRTEQSTRAGRKPPKGTDR